MNHEKSPKPKLILEGACVIFENFIGSFILLASCMRFLMFGMDFKVSLNKGTNTINLPNFVSS